MITSPCPICKQDRETMERYPNSVCNDCCITGIFASNSDTADRIEFGNVDFSGGFQSCVNGVIGEQHECYIKGRKCYANEARFGGIVISCMNVEDDENNEVNKDNEVNENNEVNQDNVNKLKRKYQDEYNYYLKLQNNKIGEEVIKDNNSILVNNSRPTIEVMNR